MDVEEPQDDGKPSAKILPFASPPVPAVETPNPLASAQAEWLEALADAVDDAPWSKTRQQDLEALEDEHVFRKRFGFDANREQRRQVIEFKHRDDVTDAEIRILRRSGSIGYHPHGVEILAPAVVAAWGYVQIVGLGLLMLLPLLRFGFRPNFSWPIFLGILPIEAVLVWLVKFTDDVYIRPHRIRQRILRKKK